MPMDAAQRVLIAAADPAERMRLSGILSEGGFMSSSCADGREIADMLRATRSGILLTQLTLRAADAISVLRALHAERLPITPAAIVLAHAGMEPFAREALDAGACRVLPSRSAREEIQAACRGVTPEDRLYGVRGRERDIASLLGEMGFPEEHLGTLCLQTALLYTLSDDRLLKDLAHGLYPIVARVRGTDPSRVERSIRHAIEASAASGQYERQYAIFGNTIDEKRGKPTNGGMLARATEYLRAKEIDET